MSEITFEVVENISNVILAFRGGCFSVTYKGLRIALSGTAMWTIGSLYWPSITAGGKQFRF